MGKRNEAKVKLGRVQWGGWGPHTEGSWTPAFRPVEWEKNVPPGPAGLGRQHPLQASRVTHKGLAFTSSCLSFSVCRTQAEAAGWWLSAPETQSHMLCVAIVTVHVLRATVLCLGQEGPHDSSRPRRSGRVGSTGGQSWGPAEDTGVLVSHALKGKQC